LEVEQFAGLSVRLMWYYFPIAQGAVPVGFNIYWDSGTGQIDYSSELGSVDYIGPRYYSFETGVFSEDSYKFCVRGLMSHGRENGDLGIVRIQMRDIAPESVGLLNANVI